MKETRRQLTLPDQFEPFNRRGLIHINETDSSYVAASLLQDIGHPLRIQYGEAYYNEHHQHYAPYISSETGQNTLMAVLGDPRVIWLDKARGFSGFKPESEFDTLKERIESYSWPEGVADKLLAEAMFHAASTLEQVLPEHDARIQQITNKFEREQAVYIRDHYVSKARDYRFKGEDYLDSLPERQRFNINDLHAVISSVIDKVAEYEKELLVA